MCYIAGEHHCTEMHMLLPGTPQPLSPVIVQMLPNTLGTEITSSTHTLLAKSTGAPNTGLSPHHATPVSPVVTPVSPVATTGMNVALLLTCHSNNCSPSIYLL